MIKFINKDIKAAYVSGIPIKAIYVLGQLMFPIIPDNPEDDILSCFFMGYWIDDYPWTDDLPWKD